MSDPYVHLESLVSLYKRGMQEPLSFMPTTSNVFLNIDKPEKRKAPNPGNQRRSTWAQQALIRPLNLSLVANSPLAQMV